MTLIELYNSPLSVLVAGVAGSLLRVSLATTLTRQQAATHLVTGALMALFVAPAAVEHWFGVKGISTQRAAAFAIGVAGPLLAEIALRLLQRRGDRLADSLVDRVTGSHQQELKE